MNKYLLIISVLAGLISCSRGGDKKPDPAPIVVTPQTCTVTFVTNGGGQLAPLTVNSGAEIPDPGAITRNHYAFEGWYSDTALTNKVTFPYTVTRSTNLYAKWAMTLPPTESEEINSETAKVLSEPFLMPIEDVFGITGRDGVVVTGRVERGVVRVGDEIEIVGGGKPIKRATVTSIEMFRKLLDQAEVGDNVGVLIKGIEKSDITRGQALAKPGSVR